MILEDLPVFYTSTPETSFITARGDANLGVLEYSFTTVIATISMVPDSDFTDILPMRNTVADGSRVFLNPVNSIYAARYEATLPIVSSTLFAISSTFPGQISIRGTFYSVVKVAS